MPKALQKRWVNKVLTKITCGGKTNSVFYYYEKTTVIELPALDGIHVMGTGKKNTHIIATAFSNGYTRILGQCEKEESATRKSSK